MNTDRIEKQILLEAPRSQVWKALANSNEFGLWFGMKFERPFVAGSPIFGKISPTTVDAEVAKMQKPFEGLKSEFFVHSIEPESKLCLMWHPFAIDQKVDYSSEPMTLITFTLEEKVGGTLLTIEESGFDKIPESRRADARRANDGGWAHQCLLIEKYLKL